MRCRNQRFQMSNPDAHSSERHESALYSGTVARGINVPVLIRDDSSAIRIQGTPFIDSESLKSTSVGSSQIPRGFYFPSQDEVLHVQERTNTSLRFVKECSQVRNYADMAEQALTDNLALTQPNGAILAAGSPYYAFVWPRDTAFNAVAYAVYGYDDEAIAALEYVLACADPSGLMQARYMPHTPGEVPDERGYQHDGLGFILWAIAEVIQIIPQSKCQKFLSQYEEQIVLCAHALCGLVDARGIPLPSQDYWEIDVDATTLGVISAVAAGLRGASWIAQCMKNKQLASHLKFAEKKVRDAMRREWAPRGYQRFADGGGMDTAVCFILPPFQEANFKSGEFFPGAVTAWERAEHLLRLVNGGYKPGESWGDGKTAWTPEAGFFALSASYCGRSDVAHRILMWLMHYRTRHGSLPEKVSSEKKPAAAAPLALTNSLVLLTIARMAGVSLPEIKYS